MFGINSHLMFCIILLFLSSNNLIKSNPVTTQLPQECRNNEVYMECGPCNEKRCYTIFYFVDPCRFNKCSPPGCYCEEGYGKKSVEDDTCVSLSTCLNE
uniref:TIL domain-containing protein n=1 Tax=Strongyloides venezuelensis TaxID=75913 RepID=A0A0K0FHH5_STRVS